MPPLLRMVQIGVVILSLATTTLCAEKAKAASKPGLGNEALIRADSLDTAAVHALYMDGEFDPAVKKLENARRMGWLKTHGDSVFAYKHLGVMYAAKYETQET